MSTVPALLYTGQFPHNYKTYFVHITTKKVAKMLSNAGKILLLFALIGQFRK